MIKKEKLKEISKSLTANPHDFISAFRNNLFMYVSDKEITLSDIAESADIPYATLNSFLYGKSNNVRIDTAVKLAKALEVSIDELVGSGTVNPITRESLSVCRELPDHSLYLVRYFIRHQGNIYRNIVDKEKTISVLMPPCSNGNLLTTNVTKSVELINVPTQIRPKIYLGLQIPCEHYMPYYAPGDILLIAADREAHAGERCIVTYKGEIYIVVKKNDTKDKNKYKYVSLINEKFEIRKENIDDKVGYIVGFLNSDCSFGFR